MNYVKSITGMKMFSLLAFIILLSACGESDRTVETSYDDVVEEAEEITDDLEDAYAEGEYTVREEAEDVLQSLENKIAEIRSEVDPNEGIDEEIEQQLEELETHRDNLQESLAELEDSGSDTWDEIVEGLEASIDEIRELLDL